MVIRAAVMLIVGGMVSEYRFKIRNQCRLVEDDRHPFVTTFGISIPVKRFCKRLTVHALENTFLN